MQVITITSWRVSEDTLVQNRQGARGEGRASGGGGNAGLVYFNNNTQTHGHSGETLNETLGLRLRDKTQMLKRGDG